MSAKTTVYCDTNAIQQASNCYDLEQLEGSWPAKVISMQRYWIGRSLGADVDFEIEGRDHKVTVFTTRPDTLFGATA